jgi:hypothetical protein
MRSELAYKFLSGGSVGLHSGYRWPVPERDSRGSWVEAQGELLECGNGIHACRTADLPYWIDDELWEIELAGEITALPLGLVARRGRLVRRIEGWDARAAAQLARSCADQARERAVRVLEASGLAEAAREASAAADLDASLASLTRAFAEIPEFPGRVAGYAADVAQYALSADQEGADWAACAAYVDAYLAGFVASGGTTEHPDHEAAFHEARRAQARWLADRLALGVCPETPVRSGLARRRA